MANPPSKLWMIQADSDMHCASRVFAPDEHRSYCQTISKYQQTVEKAVKAVIAAASEIGIIKIQIEYNHHLEKLINSLTHLPKSKDISYIQDRLNKTLNGYWKDEILELSKLAPRRPAPGALNPRNTEYPFEIVSNIWVAPAAKDSFSEQDVKRYRATAEKVFEGCKQLLKLMYKAAP